MKLYSIEVALFATAYVQADSPEEAKQKLNDTLMKSPVTASGRWFNGSRFEDVVKDPHAVVTLSPAMTPDHILSDEAKQVHP